MLDAYYPNSLRVEQLNGAKAITGFKPEYGMKFDLEDNDHFQALKKFNLSMILEGLLLYDRVYIDVIEFPIYIAEMANEDLKSTIEILENGWMSVLNAPDMRIFPESEMKNNSIPWLALGHMYESGKTEVSIESGLRSFVKDENQLKEILRCLPTVMKNSKKIADAPQGLGKYICTEIDKEIRNKCYRSIGIGQLGEYYITSGNRNLFFHIGNVISSDIMAKKAGIRSVIRNDIQEAIAKQRYVHYNIIPENFETVMRLNKIPDFKAQIQIDKITLHDIVALRKSIYFGPFSQWLRNNSENDADIAQEFLESIKQPTSGDLRWKMVRFVTTTSIGLIPVVGGLISTAAGALDTFLLDNLLDRKSPVQFVRKVESKIDSENNKTHNLGQQITIPITNGIFVDNSMENEINKKKTDERLSKKIEEIKKYTDEEKIYHIYLDSMKIHDEYPHPLLNPKYLLLNFLLVTKCPNHMIEGLVRLDDFFYQFPLEENEQNSRIVCKYYFGSVNNAVFNYRTKAVEDKAAFAKQKFKCVEIKFPEGVVKIKKEGYEKFYRDLKKEFGIDLGI